MGRSFTRALVTGASSGIGRAVVLELVRRGALVVAIARRGDRLEDLLREAERVCGRSGCVHIEVLDVADTSAVRAAVEHWDRAFDGEAGRGLDLVVANAGVGLGEHARALSWAAIERTIAVNLLGGAATLHAALPHMLARDAGTLCGISSLAGRGGMPGSGAYAASKAALSTLIETLAVDLADSGVRVCDVQPGYVHSEMTAGAKHALPLVWSAERAARHIVDALERGRSKVAFPWPLVLALHGLALAPRGVWRGIFAALGRRR